MVKDSLITNILCYQQDSGNDTTESTFAHNIITAKVTVPSVSPCILIVASNQKHRRSRPTFSIPYKVKLPPNTLEAHLLPTLADRPTGIGRGGSDIDT
jgi:hypothetical protein